MQILYGRPYAQRRLTCQALEDLRDALRRPPWLLEPPDVWRAYRRLNDALAMSSSNPRCGFRQCLSERRRFTCDRAAPGKLH